MSWRDGADKVPQHAFDLKITDHYAPLVTEALRVLFPAGLLERAIDAARAVVAKSADPDTVGLLRNAAKAALAAGGGGSRLDLESVLRSVFADAYGSGAYAAARQVGGAAVTLQGISGVDWSAWKPGDPLAADLAANGGLARLLDGVGASVNGISGSLLDQLGNQIAAGVAAGDSVATVGRSLSGIIGDPSRAEMIAHTETARAVTAATMDTYSANGVGQWDWVLSDDACPECEEQESRNPHEVSDPVQVPLHPRCRCAASPVASSVSATGGSGGSLGSDLLGDVAGVVGDELLGSSVDADVADSGPADLSSMSDDDLASAVTSATASDAEIDRIIAELDARQAAADKEQLAEAKRAAARVRSQERRAADQAVKDARFEELSNSGMDPLEAYAEAFGKNVEKLRVKDAIAQARANDYHGRNLEEVARDMQRDWAERAWHQAEDATRGHMLSHEAEMRNARDAATGGRTITAKSLFSGSDARARKWASKELLEWWEQNGRLTVDDFKQGMLGGKVAVKAYFL